MSTLKKLVLIVGVVVALVIVGGIGYAGYKRSTDVGRGVRTPLPISEPNREYNLYYGQFHAHTREASASLPDFGQGTYAEAFAYARDVSKLDFIAMTSHLFSMDQESFQRMKAAANAANEDGKFITFWGEEPGATEAILSKRAPQIFPQTGPASMAEDPGYQPPAEPLLTMGNLLNKYHYSGFSMIIGANGHYPASFGVWRDIYDWMPTSGASFGIFNHPQKGDFGDYYSPDMDQMMAIAGVFVGDDPNEPTFDFSDGYLWLLSKGWHVGAQASPRNMSLWGSSHARTGVWADNLTRESLTEAVLARRTFATQASDLSLMLRANGSPMGQEINADGDLAIVVQASSKSLEVTRIELYKGNYGSQERAQMIADFEPLRQSVVWNHTVLAFSGTQYFLVKIVMSNGAKAWSSPVWVTSS